MVYESAEWIYLANDIVHYRDFVNKGINFVCHIRQRMLWQDERLLGFWELRFLGFLSIQLLLTKAEMFGLENLSETNWHIICIS
jgi:hypothetical protein